MNPSIFHNKKSIIELLCSVSVPSEAVWLLPSLWNTGILRPAVLNHLRFASSIKKGYGHSEWLPWEHSQDRWSKVKVILLSNFWPPCLKLNTPYKWHFFYKRQSSIPVKSDTDELKEARGSTFCSSKLHKSSTNISYHQRL